MYQSVGLGLIGIGCGSFAHSAEDAFIWSLLGTQSRKSLDIVEIGGMS